MLNDAKIAQAVEFARINGMAFQEGEVRPWGSWDLVIQAAPEPKYVMTGHTFGSAFTTEHGYAIYLNRIADGKLTSEENVALAQYLGKSTYDAICSIFKTVEKPSETMSLVKI